MVAPAHILGVGVGVPALRVAAAEIAAAWGESARGTVAACAADEDPLTLAWAAADSALTAAGIRPDDVDGLWWGCTRPPYAEGPSHATLAAAVGLSAHASGLLASGSPHCGMDALLAAWDALVAGSATTALVVCSDALLPGLGSTGERRTGAGAVALVLASDGGTARLVGRATRSEPVLDRYRGTDEQATRDVYDGRLFREEVFLPVVSEVGTALSGSAEVTAWSLPDPDGQLGAAVAKRLGAAGATAAADATAAALGDTGAASALLGAVGALAARGRVAVVGFGGGRATGVTIDIDAPVPGASDAARLDDGRAASYAELLRARGQLVPAGETVAMGVPPGSAMFVRGAREMLQLLGARCVDCGVVSTPPSVHPHCVGCGGDKFTEVPLGRTGAVHTYAINHAMPAPFVAPLPLAVIDLDDGARIMLQVVGDGATLDVGTPVRLVLRRYALERGAPVYGWKAEAR